MQGRWELFSQKTNNGWDTFKGEEIESLKPSSTLLADFWVLKLKNGTELHLGLDWRGSDCYIGLYKWYDPQKDDITKPQTFKLNDMLEVEAKT